MTSRWVHREYNLMLKLSSDKMEEKYSLSCSLSQVIRLKTLNSGPLTISLLSSMFVVNILMVIYYVDFTVSVSEIT